MHEKLNWAVTRIALIELQGFAMSEGPSQTRQKTPQGRVGQPL